MAVSKFEVGFVSASTGQVTFLKEVFELEPLDEVPAGPGVLYRFNAPGGVIKVMVPKREPKALDPPRPFYSAAGLRYLTVYVDDLDAVLARAAERGGRVQHGPIDLGRGVRLAIIEDPDGNPFEVVHNSNG
jgi:predicted enzyme related to lactoylglutathione lyase